MTDLGPDVMALFHQSECASADEATKVSFRHRTATGAGHPRKIRLSDIVCRDWASKALSGSRSLQQRERTVGRALLKSGKVNTASAVKIIRRSGVK